MIYAYTFYFSSFFVSLFNPFYGLLGLVISILIRFQDRFPDIVSIKPFSLLFFGMVMGCIINRNKLSQLKWKQDKLLLAMLLVSIFGLIVREPGDILSETWEFISSLAFYFFATRILQTPRQIQILFAVMSCCIAYLGYEVFQDAYNNPETSLFIDPRNGRWQGLGYYANANEFGQLMITTIPFLFSLLLIKNSVWVKILSTALIVGFIFIVGKTGSRTVMVLLGLMFVLTFVLRGSGNVIKKVLVGGSGVAFLFVLLSFAPGPIKERLNTLTDVGSDKSFQGRTRSWEHGFDMVSWYPITGVGKGQWMEYHGLMPHNSYIQIMAELGPLGILFFLIVMRLSMNEFIPFFKEKIRERHKPPDSVMQNNSVERDADDEIAPEVKSLVIAIAIIFICWAIYIFVGNQGYSVWTYFYIGVCGAIRNFSPMQEAEVKDENKSVFV